MSAIKIIQAFAKKFLTKDKGSGITTLPSQFMAESKAGEIAARLQQAGIPINQLDDYIRSEADLLKFLNIIESTSKPRVISGSSAEGKAITEKLLGKKGEVISFKDKIEAMKKSGDIVDTTNLKKNDKVLTREMFKNSNLNKEPISEKFIDYTIQDINKKEPLEGMKIANKIIKREGEFKDLTEAQSQRILKETDDHLTGRDLDYDPEDFYAKGGRAGHYTGGIVDVEPSLDDIGHGSDALMARTRLVSPGNQATTSTGLNYLLAEDNDNMRVPFGSGGSYDYGSMQYKIDAVNAAYRRYKKGSQTSGRGGKMTFEQFAPIWAKENFAEGGRIGFSAGGAGRRAFLKLLASIGGGVAAAKSGILSLGGKEAGKQTAKEIVKSAGSGTPPPYFFKLVEKIKTLGDDVTVGSSTTPRTKVTKYKNYELTESLDGSKQIQKIGKEDDMITQNEYMTYTKGQADETTKGKKPADDYEEVTETNSRIYKDNFNDPDYEDGINLKEILKEVDEPAIKKADGGRIGFSVGSKVIGKGIMAGINKLFGKGTMTTADKLKRPQKALDREMFKNFETKYPETSAADATLNIPVQQEGKFTKAEYLIQRLKNTIKGNPNDKYVQDTFPNFIKELKDNPELAKNENVFKELGGDLPEGQQIVVYGDDSIDFFTQKSGPKNIDRIKKIMSKYNISKDKALKIMKMEPNDQVMEFKMLEIANRKLNATGGRIGYNKGKLVKGIISLFKKKPKKPETVKSFLDKRQFLKSMVGNTEKNKKARDLKMLKEAAEKARKEGGFKFENVDIDKDIRPIFDKEIAKSLKKNRKLNATGGLANMLGE